LDTIDAASLNTFVLGTHPDTGADVVVKPGLYGPYVRCGEDTASVPDSMTPDELTLELAVELLNAPKGDVPIGEHDGHPVFVKTGRYGAYVQWGTMDNPPEGLEKPKMASLFKTMNVDRMTMKLAVDLLSLPRPIGEDPADGEVVYATNGRYGPYVYKGKESRSLQNEDQIFEITIEEALALLATPRTFGRGRAAPKPPLREFGVDPVSGKPVVGKEGRFGDYVTDGETNAGLTRGDRMESMTNERAHELLQLRREYIEANGGAKKKPAKKKPPKKSPPEKKPPTSDPGNTAELAKKPAKKKPPKKAAPKKKPPTSDPGNTAELAKKPAAKKKAAPKKKPPKKSPPEKNDDE
jgi:DNA topoisomerase-1